MKYFHLILILTLSSCSFDKNSSWNESQINQSINDKKLLDTKKNNTNFQTMTFDEFNLFVEDYAKNAEYPNINN